MQKIFFLLILILFNTNFLYAKEYKKICFSSICIDAEVVQSDSDREKGLMFRKQLNDNDGMFFVFEQDAIYGFWMKNMLISLDIIWINKNLQVVDISEHVMPCKDECIPFYPQEEVRYVLEVKDGFVKKNNIKKGQILKLEK